MAFALSRILSANQVPNLLNTFLLFLDSLEQKSFWFSLKKFT